MAAIDIILKQRYSVKHLDAIDPYSEETLAFIEDGMETFGVINVVALGLVSSANEGFLDFTKIKTYASANGIVTKTMNRFPSLNLIVSGMTVILFKNGKIVFTGTKDLATLHQVSGETRDILQHAMQEPLDIDVQIQNMVGMIQVETFVDLEDMCLSMENCIYEPEQFPACIIKRRDRHGVYLVFSNGKIICLGFKSIDEIKEESRKFLGKIHPYVREF